MYVKNQKSFSMLESVLSLLLLSIVAVFVFRYIFIFYENYGQIKQIYTKNVDIDKAMMLIFNKYQNRAKGTENKSKNYILEFTLKDTILSRGVFFGDENRWLGIGGVLEINSTNSSAISDIKVLNSKMIYLDYLDKDFFRTSKYIALYDNEDEIFSSKVGYSKTKAGDVFLMKCKNSYCRNNLVVMQNMNNFTSNDKVQKAMLSVRNRHIYFSLLNSSVAFLVDKDNNFVMYSDYYPWKGDKYTKGVKHIVANKISSFNYTSSSDGVYIQLCSSKNNCKNMKL